MDFDSVIYGQTFDSLEGAIRATSVRQKQIAQNIANIESGNFKPFNDVLKNTLSKHESKEAMLDREMTNLAESNLKITSYAQLLSSKLKILRKVVTLGKG